MKDSEKDKWLDRLISRLAAGDKPVPNFEKWKQDHPEAVRALKSQAGQGSPHQRNIWMGICNSRITKLAAAAVLLIFAGYAFGRLSAPRAVDVDALETSLKSSLEPAIRRNLLEEANRHWQLALAGSYVRLKDELNQQLRSDMNKFAVQILAASGAVTNQRLVELIDAINAAQKQERRWFAAGLEQIELNRLQDSAQLRNDFATFAVLTEDQLRRTKQDMAQLLFYPQPENPVPD